MDGRDVVQKYITLLMGEDNSYLQTMCEAGYIGFSLTTDGSSEIIEMDALRLWCSDDDVRVWNEKTQDYEPIDDLVIRELENHVDAVTSFIELLKKGLEFVDEEVS